MAFMLRNKPSSSTCPPVAIRSPVVVVQLLLAMLLPVDSVWALAEATAPSRWDIAFYTFALTGIAFSTAIITAYREYNWLAYVVFSLLLLINVAALDGDLTFLFGRSDFVLWLLPFLLASTTTAYGYWMIALRLADSHALARFKQPIYVLAAISAFFPLSSYFWLGEISLATMWIPVNILFFGMVAAQILPPLSWPVSDPRLSLLIRVFPATVGLFALGVYGVHFSTDGFDQARLSVVNQLAMLLFAGFSLTIVVWQAFIRAREKDEAERRAIEEAKNAAELKLSLLQAEQNYKRAQSAAAAHRTRLATVSHDLSQPISALRVAVAQIQRARADGGNLSRAVDYIASLAHSYIDEGLQTPSDTDPDTNQQRSKEPVSTTTFTGSLSQMFGADADHHGITLKVAGPETQVLVEPLQTLRVMSNLVANAIKHSNAKRILLGFRRRGDSVTFQVHDDGDGMDAQALADAMTPLSKGSESSGHGLGLGIVKALCEAQSMPFTIRSTPGSGTSAYIEMARIGAESATKSE